MFRGKMASRAFTDAAICCDREYSIASTQTSSWEIRTIFWIDWKDERCFEFEKRGELKMMPQ